MKCIKNIAGSTRRGYKSQLKKVAETFAAVVQYHRSAAKRWNFPANQSTLCNLGSNASIDKMQGLVIAFSKHLRNVKLRNLAFHTLQLELRTPPRSTTSLLRFCMIGGKGGSFITTPCE
jgi:hypothetical protein